MTGRVSIDQEKTSVEKRSDEDQPRPRYLTLNRMDQRVGFRLHAVGLMRYRQQGVISLRIRQAGTVRPRPDCCLLAAGDERGLIGRPAFGGQLELPRRLGDGGNRGGLRRPHLRKEVVAIVFGEHQFAFGRRTRSGIRDEPNMDPSSICGAQRENLFRHQTVLHRVCAGGHRGLTNVEAKRNIELQLGWLLCE